MRTISDPGFGDDDGSADPGLRATLAGYADDLRPAPVLAALTGARLLVPVKAVPVKAVPMQAVPMQAVPMTAAPDEAAAGDTGHVVAKSSDMAAVLMTGRDGRQALLAFTGTAALAAWDASARPVPVAAQLAATAACQEGASALLIDVAGPVRFVVQGDDLLRMAAGDALVEVPGGHAWAP